MGNFFWNEEVEYENQRSVRIINNYFYHFCW